MMDIFNTRTIQLDSGDPEQKRQEIKEYFKKTWALDDRLYEHLVRDEAFYQRPEPLRHPLIFYFGHTAGFYINKLIVARLLENRVNAHYESMFAIGVDEMSWDDLDERNYDWPEVEQVREYREEVRGLVLSVITELPLTMPITWDDPFWLIMMGIEHQRIHIETSSIIIRRMELSELRQLPQWEYCPHTGEPPENQLLPVEGGSVHLGKGRDHMLYGWDNEFGSHEAVIEGFLASEFLVSNREFLSFIEDGGYHKSEWWTEEGRQWLEFSEATHPLFWRPAGEEYRLRLLAREIPMAWNWPVEVNWLEAKAFCNWKASITERPIRLPTEDEYYRLYDLHDLPDQPYWQKAPGNINLEYWTSSCPVDHFRFGKFCDVIGNVWQWTETPISGFEGFEVHPWYDDFSTPTFDTQHNLFKGGSWISTGNEATRDARYAFRRHFFQHAGFRYIESEAELDQPQPMYESDHIVSQYCEAHYGRPYHGVLNFQVQCAAICLEQMADKAKKRALDLGCSVGRASFELAREFEFVQGLDFSARFIRIGHQLQERGMIRYELAEEGDNVTFHEHRLEEFGLEDVADRVEFFQADAMNLKPRFTEYDLILAANLLDRLPDPATFLQSIHTRLNSGGMLVLSSPYTWLTEFTEKSKWLGGFRQDGEPVTALETITEILDPHFNLVEGPRDLEFVLRETARKFQHTISQLTLWQLKDA